MNLGWSSNVQGSNDEMKWINISDTYINYIKAITLFSFISEDSFVWTFIDFYYNLNYIDIQLELNDFTKYEQALKKNQFIKDDIEKVGELYLTNNKIFSSTNIYISKFDLINQSYKVNLEKSYKMKATWYDKNDNTIFKKYIKELKTTKDNIKKLYDYDSKIYCENINDEYFIGKLDSDNVHKNYYYAEVSNKFNLDNLQKMKLVITMNQINFSIRRFQNILVEIYNPDDLFSSTADKDPPGENINKFLSGHWFVTGINYLYRRSGGQEQEITLVRRDLNLKYGEGKDERHDIRKYSENKK
jgi:hypothetical protein